ncbi:type III-A CRISPR-associated protein Csm2 [Aureivirga sp. CE67]|uniref:type III-A CRISPR-associated protein Csm2 n=1 Tax=Aureivirga sp. CE67 TaxID=1788983 RepID=UPI0018C94A6C|nr:type III-A CRISPR-associated protein Csm2 [Aureivirga sp. CE67]
MSQKNTQKQFELVRPKFTDLAQENIPNDFFEKLEKYVKHKFGSNGKSDITPTQLRNIYNLIKKENNVSGMKQLQPKMVYTAARIGGKGKDLVIDMKKDIQNINTYEEVKAFKQYMEAILAYHKFYFPKDNK